MTTRTPLNSASFHRRSSHRNRGMSLVEICAVMAANAAVIAAATATFMVVGRADRKFTQRLDDPRAIAALIDRLRDDLHASTALAWNETPQTLRLTQPDGSAILYSSDAKQWVRRELTPAEASDSADDFATATAAAQLAGAFPTPTPLHLAIAPTSATAGELIRITLAAAPVASTNDVDDHADAEGNLSIEPSELRAAELVATLGRDERLLHE